MAGRYLVLRMDSREAAQALMNNPAVAPWVELVGEFAFPTDFCECETPTRNARSKKFGWWICVDCKKPRLSMPQSPNNLLPDNYLKEIQEEIRLHANESKRTRGIQISVGALEQAALDLRRKKRAEKRGLKRR